MNTYLFYFEKNKFLCQVNDEIINNSIEAREQLEAIDYIHYQKMKVHKQDIVLINDDTVVTIQDIHKICNSNSLASRLKNTLPIIQRGMKLNQIKKLKKRITKNIPLNSKKVLASTFVAAMLLSTLHEENEFVDNLKQVEAETEAFEDETSLPKIGINDIIDNLDNDIETNNETILNEQNNELLTDEISDEETPDTYITNDDSLNEVDTILLSSLSLDVENISDCEKCQNVIQTYGDLIKEVSSKYGISENLITGILTQETGGYEDNLMQIEFDKNKNQVLSVYNFDENKYNKIVLTGNPAQYSSDTICISREEYLNPKTNISYATAKLSYLLDYYHGNVLLATTAYNYGIGSVDYILRVTASNTGTPIEDLINNYNNTEFMNYRHLIHGGDPIYIENVARYFPDIEDGIQIKHMGKDGNIYMTKTLVSYQNVKTR